MVSSSVVGLKCREIRALEPQKFGSFSTISNVGLLFFCPADKDSNDSAVPCGFEDNDELQSHGKAPAATRLEDSASIQMYYQLRN